jgi:hypothetical protein
MPSAKHERNKFLKKAMRAPKSELSMTLTRQTADGAAGKNRRPEFAANGNLAL